MNVNDYKFIVSSGCSYGVMMRSLFYKNTYLQDVYTNFGDDILNYEYDKDKIIFIGLGLPSQSSEWISDSIQYTITKLLNKGVSSENIYCFAEWTQYDRVANTTENFIKLDELSTSNLAHLNSNLIISEIFNELDIKFLNDLQGVGIIGDCPYINSPSILSSQIENVFGIDGKLMHEKHFEIHKKTTNVSLIKRYLSNIISLQNFLKSNDIKYNFCNMQSEFHGWVKSGFEYQQKIKKETKYHKYYVDNRSNIVENLNYDNTKSLGIHITEAYPQIRHLYNLIDFTHYWFYNNDEYRFGGIDEYFLNEYDIFGYSNLMHWTGDKINPFDIVGGYNWHPTEILYTLLHNEVCFNNPFVSVKSEWIDYLKKMLNEDIEYDGITKHKISCSKQYYKTILKYESIQS